MAEVVLNDPQIAALVCQGETAGVAKHMWINTLESGTGAGGPNNVVHGLPCERHLTLGDEEPGQCIVPAREPALDSPQLVASDWLLDTEPVLQPCDPDPRLREIHISPSKCDHFGDAQAVPEHHQDQEVITTPAAALLGGSEKPVNIRLTKVVPPPDMGIGRAVIVTLDTSPGGHGSDASHKSPLGKAWP